MATGISLWLETGDAEAGELLPGAAERGFSGLELGQKLRQIGLAEETRREIALLWRRVQKIDPFRVGSIDAPSFYLGAKRLIRPLHLNNFCRQVREITLLLLQQLHRFANLLPLLRVAHRQILQRNPQLQEAS
jgi:hypothetical protein